MAFANHSSPEHKQQRAVAGSSDALLQSATRATQDKYDRILAFVDAHATPVVLDNTWGSSSSSTSVEQHVTSSWHHSYDEEVEEGEELNEPAVLAYAATVPTAVAESAAAAVVAVNAALPSWGYGDPINPKPFFYAWDEEAEGAFELEQVCSTSQSVAATSAVAAGPMDPAAAAAALRAQRRAALHEARHAARATRRMRRSQLHPQLGDLEHMPAWVQPAGQQQQRSSNGSQRSAAGIKYQQLLALVAGDAAHGQYRKPKQWHLTFDEDVHGPEVPETVLGSC